MNKIELQTAVINLFLKKYLPKYKIVVWRYAKDNVRLEIEDCKTLNIEINFVPNELFFPIFKRKEVTKYVNRMLKDFAGGQELYKKYDETFINHLKKIQK